MSGDTWLVIGNEGAGVSADIQQAAGAFVRIPMPGRAESLNAAMAATVLLFGAARQRSRRPGFDHHGRRLAT